MRRTLMLLAAAALVTPVSPARALPGGSCGPGNPPPLAVNAGAVTQLTEDWYDASFTSGKTKWTILGGNIVMVLYRAPDISGGCVSTSWGSCWAGAGGCIFGPANPGQYLIQIKTGGPISRAGGAYVLLMEKT